MSDRSKLINRLLHERDFRAAYIRAKLDVLIPSQLRALRDEKTQSQIAEETGMKQARISAMETPGLVNFNRETLVRMAATHNVGLVIKFVPFSEMLSWENEYSQDTFNVVRLADDINFIQPARIVRRRARRKRSSRSVLSSVRIAQMPITATGAGASRYAIPVQRERAQLKLQFEPPEQPSAQARIAKVITLSNRGGSVLNALPFLKTAAAGGGRNYGN